MKLQANGIWQLSQCTTRILRASYMRAEKFRNLGMGHKNSTI